LFTGLILGLALVLDGFGSMLIVALIGFIGWVVAKVGDGEIDPMEYLSGRRARQSR
jgi:hypothetical protein